ncbi:MAG: hypothetical protein QNJ90_01455 [Planctomycetota bacterium]|nr:hypothetical protein [Planctomycetota bacterium]
MRNTIVALALGLALVAGGLAFAGEDAPVAKPAAETKTAPTTVAKKPETATESPIHSMMKWVAGHVSDDCACPSTEKGEKQWRAWFASKDAKLAGLRDAMVADGWNADRTIGYFKKMMAAKSGSDCGSCDKAASCDKAKSCGGCDKSKSGGAAAPTGDAGTSGATAKSSKCCGSCDKAKDCSGGGCDKSKSCGGCDKSKSGGASAATGDAGTTGDASGKKSSCGGCDKAKSCDKSKDCSGGGCDKSKASGASAPTGDAGTTGDASAKKKACPCTGKPMSECGGCEKTACPCGKDGKTTDK